MVTTISYRPVGSDASTRWKKVCKIISPECVRDALDSFAGLLPSVVCGDLVCVSSAVIYIVDERGKLRLADGLAPSFERETMAKRLRILSEATNVGVRLARRLARLALAEFGVLLRKNEKFVSRDDREAMNSICTCVEKVFAGNLEMVVCAVDDARDFYAYAEREYSLIVSDADKMPHQFGKYVKSARITAAIAESLMNAANVSAMATSSPEDVAEFVRLSLRAGPELESSFRRILPLSSIAAAFAGIEDPIQESAL